MNTVTNSFIQKSNIKKLIITISIYLVVFIFINGNYIGIGKLLKITSGINILDFLSKGYSVQSAYTVFNKMGYIGRDYYLTDILPFDFIFSMIGMLFFSTLTAFLIKKLELKSSLCNYLIFLPLTVMICDWAENTCIISMLYNYPVQLKLLCNISSIFTKIKFILGYPRDIFIFILIITNIIRVIKRKVRTHN